MKVNVTLDLPDDVVERLHHEFADLESAVMEAALIDLYRQGKIDFLELANALGLDRFETGGFLKRHNVFEGSLTMEDLEADRKTMERIMGKHE